MSKKSLSEIAKQMAGIDIAILSTQTEGDKIANRPMSNNGDVTYDGTSFYFTNYRPAPFRTSNVTRKWHSGFVRSRHPFRGVYVAVSPSGLFVTLEF